MGTTQGRLRRTAVSQIWMWNFKPSNDTSVDSVSILLCGHIQVNTCKTQSNEDRNGEHKVVAVPFGLRRLDGVVALAVLGQQARLSHA